MKSVYFISDGRGHIKIGISDNPVTRMAALQTGSPLRLTLLCSFRGTEADERWLHESFWCDRVVGEWFMARGESAGGLESFVDFLMWWLGPDHAPNRRGPPYTIEEICDEWMQSHADARVYGALTYDTLEWSDAAQVGA